MTVGDVLTINDPEPPVFSVVRDSSGIEWERDQPYGPADDYTDWTQSDRYEGPPDADLSEPESWTKITGMNTVTIVKLPHD